MAHGGVPQSNCEADLVHHYAEKAHIEESPKIAEGKFALPALGRPGKSRQTRAKLVEREHHHASEHDTEGCQRRRRQRPQPNFRSDGVNRPYDDDYTDRCGKAGPASRSLAR